MKAAEKKAVVPWSDLKLDLLILALGVATPIVSLFVDAFSQTEHHFLARSGAVMVVASAYLAYCSLRRHALKAKILFEESEWRLTSRTQSIIDVSSIILSILGTLIWAYGDFFL